MFSELLEQHDEFGFGRVFYAFSKASEGGGENGGQPAFRTTR